MMPLAILGDACNLNKRMLFNTLNIQHYSPNYGLSFRILILRVEQYAPALGGVFDRKSSAIFYTEKL